MAAECEAVEIQEGPEDVYERLLSALQTEREILKAFSLAAEDGERVLGGLREALSDVAISERDGVTAMREAIFSGKTLQALFFALDLISEYRVEVLKSFLVPSFPDGAPGFVRNKYSVNSPSGNLAAEASTMGGDERPSFDVEPFLAANRDSICSVRLTQAARQQWVEFAEEIHAALRSENEQVRNQMSKFVVEIFEVKIGDENPGLVCDVYEEGVVVGPVSCGYALPSEEVQEFAERLINGFLGAEILSRLGVDGEANRRWMDVYLGCRVGRDMAESAEGRTGNFRPLSARLSEFGSNNGKFALLFSSAEVALCDEAFISALSDRYRIYVKLGMLDVCPFRIVTLGDQSALNVDILYEDKRGTRVNVPITVLINFDPETSTFSLAEDPEVAEVVEESVKAVEEVDVLDEDVRGGTDDEVDKVDADDEGVVADLQVDVDDVGGEDEVMEVMPEAASEPTPEAAPEPTPEAAPEIPGIQPLPAAVQAELRGETLPEEEGPPSRFPRLRAFLSRFFGS